MSYVESTSEFISHAENLARTRWGVYITAIIKQSILKAHNSFEKPANALDLGAGSGRWAELLTDLGWNMTCTDVNERILDICKERIPTAHCILVKVDEDKLPCESDSINLLLCMEAFPVIQADWFPGEVDRVLQDDGVIVGVFLNRSSIRGLFAYIKGLITGNVAYYKKSYVPWRRQLVSNGYSILHEEGICWFPFKRDSGSLFVPLFVRLEKWLGLRKLVPVSPWIVFIARKFPSE